MMTGGTKKGELSRTAEMLPDILATQGLYFVVAFLADSGCQNADLYALLPHLERIGKRKP
jgi:hypothetical protein